MTPALPFFTAVVPVGSRVTCMPAPVDTDADFLCLCPDDTFNDAAVGRDLAAAGYEALSLASYSDDAGEFNDAFRSWRCGEVNLIVTSSVEFFDKFKNATKLAQRLNLLKKDDRVALFQAILYDAY